MKFQRKVVLTVAMLVLFVSPALAVNVQFLSTNDMHSRLYSEQDPKTAKIFGGFARLRTAVDVAKKEYKGDTLVVCGGDYFEGFFYYYFKGVPEAIASNMVGYDLTTIGNHEFDGGADGFVKFLNTVKYPTISSNLTFSDPALNKRIKRPHIVKTKSGAKVGFFGLTTPRIVKSTNICETGFVSVEQDDGTFKVAQEAIDELKRQDCDMIVAVTHLGHDNDLKLAQNVHGLNAIIGGHSHTKVEKLVVRKNLDGDPVIIVQTGCYAHYLGKLDLCVEMGKTNVEKSKWILEPVDSRYSENEEVAKYLATFKAELDKKFDETISTCLDPINLENAWIRSNESPLGDMLTDAVREGTKADVVIQHSGGIRGGKIIPPGPMNALSLNSILPFGNTILVTEITGKELKDIMEVSASACRREGETVDKTLRTPGGDFMQISGIRVTFDLSKKPALVDNENNVKFAGERVIKLEILKDGKYVPVDPNTTYKLATTEWTATPKEKYYTFLGKKWENTATTNKEFFIQKLTNIGKEFHLPKQDRMIFLNR